MPSSIVGRRNSFAYVTALIRLKYTPGLFASLGGVFSGASAGTYYDSSGVKQLGTGGVLREGHYIGGVRHTLIEALAATNIFTRSEPTIAQITSKTAGLTASDMTAYGFTANGHHYPALAQADHGYMATTGLAALTAYAISAFVVMDDGLAPVPSKSNTTGDFTFAWTNTGVAAGTLSTERIGAGPLYRVSIAGTTPASIAAQTAGINRAATHSGRGFKVVGLQVELGAVPTSYILTSGSTVTRAAETAYIPYTQAPERMTAYGLLTARGSVAISGAALWYLGNAGNTGARLFTDANGTVFRANHDNNGGSGVASAVVATAPARGDTLELRQLLYGDGSTELRQNINAGATDASGASAARSPLAGAWSGSRLYLGSTGSTNGGIIAIQKLILLQNNLSLNACRAA